MSGNVPLRAAGSLVSVPNTLQWADTLLAAKISRTYNINWLLGTVTSIGIAAALILLVRGTHSSVIVPVVFIVVVVLCARYFGLIAGILGAVGATAMFAFFLFAPYGSFQVDDHQALLNLGLLLFAGIALSYANADDDVDSIPRTLKSR
jgi:K+-sensing histidine kinase KdpD